MEKVPQIVSERLRAASSSVGHPDPDVLTAFSEHSLRKSERAAVVEHLARCGECREIAALALPALEQPQATVRPASEGWLTWPVLRWGFIAAGIVAIASFGVMQFQHRSANMMARQSAASEAIIKEAKNVPPTPPSAVTTEDRDKTAAAPASIAADRKDLSSASAAPSPSEVSAPALGGPLQSKRAVVGRTFPHGPRVQWQQNTNLQQQALQATGKQLRSIPVQNAPSANPESVEVESAAGAVSANLDSSSVQNPVDQQALQNSPAETRVERSKPAATALATAPVAAFSVPNPPARAQLTRQSASAPAVSGVSILWTITSAGRLQRSLDQGTTWQDMDVNNPSANSGATLELMTSTSKTKKIATDNLAKKEASAPLVFRAVASNGADVWAGASGGLLYHSTDAGGHWSRIVPSAPGVSLTGDIVSLEFVDPQHGRVVTSTPEVWTTSDSGQSWQKQ
jgi:Photosynthesis system II assembly factor YCF48